MQNDKKKVHGYNIVWYFVQFQFLDYIEQVTLEVVQFYFTTAMKELFYSAQTTGFGYRKQSNERTKKKNAENKVE